MELIAHPRLERAVVRHGARAPCAARGCVLGWPRRGLRSWDRRTRERCSRRKLSPACAVDSSSEWIALRHVFASAFLWMPAPRDSTSRGVRTTRGGTGVLRDVRDSVETSRHARGGAIVLRARRGGRRWRVPRVRDRVRVPPPGRRRGPPPPRWAAARFPSRPRPLLPTDPTCASPSCRCCRATATAPASTPFPARPASSGGRSSSTDEASSTLDARATPTPPNPRLLDARKPESWHGQLTTQGVAQLVHTGAALRAWLVDERALLPASLTDARSAGAVKIRSTSTRRTVQSAQSLILGLYPAETDSDAVASSSRATSPEPLPIEVRDRMRESMFPNPGMACERQIELMRSLDGDPSVKAAEAAAWERASLTAVRQEVHRRNLDARRAERELAAAKGERRWGFLPDSVDEGDGGGRLSERPASSPATNPNASPNDVSSASKRARDPRLPSATSVWEPLQARANHSLSLPGGVEDDDLAAIRRAAGCVTSTARRTPKAPRSPGVVCSASWRTRHTRWRTAVRRRGSPSTRATTRASSRCSRCWARLAASGRPSRPRWSLRRGRPRGTRKRWGGRTGARVWGWRGRRARIWFGWCSTARCFRSRGARDRTRLAEGLCSLDAFRAMAHARDPKRLSRRVRRCSETVAEGARASERRTSRGPVV